MKKIRRKRDLEKVYTKGEFIKKLRRLADALEKAVKEADENDIVLVCGSLYILGDAIRWLRKQELAE